MSCKTIKSNVYKVCVANLRHKIKIQYSTTKPLNSPDSNPEIDFVDTRTVWAMIKTRNTPEYIQGSNVRNSITTEFYIRFDKTFDYRQVVYIEYKGIKYRIVNATNIDERNAFMILSCKERGFSNQNNNLR